MQTGIDSVSWRVVWPIFVKMRRWSKKYGSKRKIIGKTTEVQSEIIPPLLKELRRNEGLSEAVKKLGKFSELDVIYKHNVKVKKRLLVQVYLCNAPTKWDIQG